MITALRIHIQKLKVRYPGASSYVDMEGDMQGLIGMVHAVLIIGKLRVAALSERTRRAAAARATAGDQEAVAWTRSRRRPAHL